MFLHHTLTTEILPLFFQKMPGFGCGDSDSYSDTFCDAIGIIYEDLKDTHCKFCGAVDTAGYTFDSSIAVVDGKFVGLPIDEVNEDNQTEERISAWAEQVKQEIS